jgi:hypothetical protein
VDGCWAAEEPRMVVGIAVDLEDRIDLANQCSQQFPMSPSLSCKRDTRNTGAKAADRDFVEDKMDLFAEKSRVWALLVELTAEVKILQCTQAARESQQQFQ